MFLRLRFCFRISPWYNFFLASFIMFMNIFNCWLVLFWFSKLSQSWFSSFFMLSLRLLVYYLNLNDVEAIVSLLGLELCTRQALSFIAEGRQFTHIWKTLAMAASFHEEVLAHKISLTSAFLSTPWKCLSMVGIVILSRFLRLYGWTLELFFSFLHYLLNLLANRITMV